MFRRLCQTLVIEHGGIGFHFHSGISVRVSERFQLSISAPCSTSRHGDSVDFLLCALGARKRDDRNGAAYLVAQRGRRERQAARQSPTGLKFVAHHLPKLGGTELDRKRKITPACWYRAA